LHTKLCKIATELDLNTIKTQANETKEAFGAEKTLPLLKSYA
jgi:hypothetical protein